MLKSAYVKVAQGILALPPARKLFDRAAAERRPGLGRWMASLTAIYHLDRMIALDIPWWNIAAAETVEDFLRARPDARVFEYGSGASTVWLARRCRELVSVEHDGDWLARLAPKLDSFGNASLMHRSLGGDGRAYVDAIREMGGAFDLIVVDGRNRVACMQAAIPLLKSDGLLLFDNSGRERYRAGIDGSGLSERHFHGRSYCLPYPDHTSILTAPRALAA